MVEKSHKRGANRARWSALWVIPAVVALLGPQALARTGKSPHKVYVSPSLPEIHRVAVLPLKAPTDGEREVFTDCFIAALRQSGRYVLLEPDDITQRLRLPRLAQAALARKQAVEIGKRLQVDAVAVGLLSRVETVDNRGATFPMLKLSLTLLSCEDGRVLWSVQEKAAESRAPDREQPQAREMVRLAFSKVDPLLPPREKKADPSTEPVFHAKVPVVEQNQPVPLQDYGQPDLPRGLDIAGVGLREVSLSWVRPVDRPYRYRVERATAPQGPYDILAKVAPNRGFFQDRSSPASPLEDHTTYFYRLVALARNGLESKPTEPVKVVTAPPPSPPPAIDIDAPSSRTITLAWEPSYAEGVVEYRVERSRNGAKDYFEMITETASTFYQDGGTAASDLEDSTRYAYRLRTVNRVGSIGPASEAVFATTLPTPDPIDEVVAESDGVRCVPLSWAVHPATNIVAYNIYRTDTEDGDFELRQVVTGRRSDEYLDGGGRPGALADQHTFYYIVRAVNTVGAESPASAVSSATTRGIPPVVRHVKGRSGEPRRITLAWDLSSDDKVLGYEVWRAVGDNDNFVLVGTTSSRESTTYVDRGGARHRDGLGLLLDGETYRYKVLAFNTAKVYSKGSQVATARTKDAPNMPHGLRATTDRPKSVGLVWDAGRELDIADYVIAVGAHPDARFRKHANLAAKPNTRFMSFKDLNLPDGSERYYKVKAIDVDGLESPWSEAVQGQAKPLPDEPMNLHAKYREPHITLRWDSPPQQDIREYSIWAKSIFKWELIDITENTEYRLNPSTVKKKSAVSVRAIDHDGLESIRSKPVRVDAGRL